MKKLCVANNVPSKSLLSVHERPCEQWWIFKFRDPRQGFSEIDV